MTDAPNPSECRRRKLIVAFAVFVSLVLAWWNWPRGDARFAGRWDMRLATAPDQSVGTMTFYRSGSGHHPISWAKGTINVWIPRWYVTGDQLVIGSISQPLTRWIYGYVGQPIGLLTSWEINSQEFVYQILETSTDRLKLRMNADSREFIFVRIPE